MKLVKTIDAVGHVLCHDITQIIPGKSKGPVFKKGHIVTEEDISVLLSVGKENLYIWENHAGMLHEEEAAMILRDICIGGSDDFHASAPSEGKITIMAAREGLLKIRSDALLAVNSLGRMMIATTNANLPVRAGDSVAGTRIIPLVIEKEAMDEAARIAGDEPILKVLPFSIKTAGIVTTGSEVASGRIQDAFGPVLKDKLREYAVDVIAQTILGDDPEKITDGIMAFAAKGAELILVSGGMSVDPDDRTPKAIKDTGARIISYGAPVLPGAMFLLSYLKHDGRLIPVVGLPGCVMYAKRTIFDLVLPRILAREELTAEDLAKYGEGGLCKNCVKCHFPNCGFGK
ncbi:MAG: molybdopterin-binding protein [Lachnospiraceae bacterium]|nr:molybdopterin-binding protein [Lachnospiraceae bacterium]